MSNHTMCECERVNYVVCNICYKIVGPLAYLNQNISDLNFENGLALSSLNDPEQTQTTYQSLPPLQIWSTSTMSQSITPAASADPQPFIISDFQTREDIHKNGHIPAKDSISFEVIRLPPAIDNRPRPIPRKAEKATLCFDDDTDFGIRSLIEKNFPTLRNRHWEFYKCESRSFKLVPTNLPECWKWIPSKSHKLVPANVTILSVSELRRISGFRKKLYVGIKI
ncbi:hypothetical protein C1645_739290 [Glomus cerebriforme]|uniref:Uncharacterized protein n=1 Tax=Glomus cerebriforme TaxID=658196 RepID=A0A397T0J3_9GLOM|nr:hypothetical protein C1645_739290 [Glomus cerebriforme]